MAESGMHAFLDAYGDTGLRTEKEGTSIFFIVAAVLVASSDLDDVRTGVDRVRADHFGPGEMKSSGVGGDIDRRIKILDSLSDLPFLIHIDAIDKREVDQDSGLVYKRSFLKYLHGQLYRKLVRAFTKLDVVADEHGSPEFMRGFRDYMTRKHPPNLFPLATFDFARSSGEPMIQLADFVAGSFARVIDPDKQSPEGRRVLESAGQKVLTIDEWPTQQWIHDTRVDAPAQPGLDFLVKRLSILEAQRFVEEHRDTTDEQRIRQLETIRYLVFYARFINPESYVPTKLLLRILADKGVCPDSEQAFRSGVIAGLRDSGVIIASSSRGYKLPVSAQDLVDLVSTSANVVLPMVERLKRVRDQVLRASEGRFDILADDEFKCLRVLCDGEYKSAV